MGTCVPGMGRRRDGNGEMKDPAYPGAAREVGAAPQPKNGADMFTRSKITGVALALPVVAYLSACGGGEPTGRAAMVDLGL